MNHSLLYAFECGQAGVRGKTSETSDVVNQFEPSIAQRTERRGIQGEDERPTFSLKVGGQVLVFGIEDTLLHGKRTSIRRLNSRERYLHPDYFHMLDVLYLHGFSPYRGAEWIAPTGVIAVPISVYNDAEVIDQMRNILVGQRELVDGDGCILRLHVQASRLQILPEGYGALLHYAVEPGSLKKRPEVDTTGTTLVVDEGYETADLALFEGLKFQRDRAESVLRAGMGIVTRAVHEYLGTVTRATDLSRVDRALRCLAGKGPGTPKLIEPSPGVIVDVTEVYDQEIENLSTRLAQEILTRFPEAISRVLLAGGGAYHLQRALRLHLAPLPVELAPDAELANVLGGYTALKMQQNRDR